mgnify:CR=1 FL=1
MIVPDDSKDQKIADQFNKLILFYKNEEEFKNHRYNLFNKILMDKSIFSSDACTSFED